jgi:hypothetical protein
LLGSYTAPGNEPATSGVCRGWAGKRLIPARVVWMGLRRPQEGKGIDGSWRVASPDSSRVPLYSPEATSPAQVGGPGGFKSPSRQNKPRGCNHKMIPHFHLDAKLLMKANEILEWSKSNEAKKFKAILDFSSESLDYLRVSTLLLHKVILVPLNSITLSMPTYQKEYTFYLMTAIALNKKRWVQTIVLLSSSDFSEYFIIEGYSIMIKNNVIIITNDKGTNIIPKTTKLPIRKFNR